MRTLKLAMLTAIAAFATNANAASVGMGWDAGASPANPYQPYTQAQSNIVGGGGTMLNNGSASPQVFHGGGVAACDGCHVMHNAQSGFAKSTTGTGSSVQPWTNVTNAYLLQGSDQSSTCLICHGASTPTGFQFVIADTSTLAAGVAPANYSPGGDFGWLGLNFSASPGDRHGHNVVAADFPQFTADTHLTAPGGTLTFQSTGARSFGCASCHDPHGRYRWVLSGATYQIQGPSTVGQKIAPIASSGSYGAEPTAAAAVGVYRILGGRGYAPASNPSNPFPNDPPRAVAPGTYNKVEGGGAANEVRVAYGTGMSEWCQNCHTNIHLDGYTTGLAGLRHPAGSDAFLHATQYDIYNSYISSGDMTGTNRYTSLVPFEQGAGLTFTQLAANTVSTATITAGPTSSVMCLSCHRAHASAFDSMVRWDQQATYLTDGANYTMGLNTDRQLAQTTAGYYGRTAGAAGDIKLYQRSLCNKCHGKD